MKEDNDHRIADYREHFDRGCSLLQDGQSSEALSSFEEAIKSKREEALAWYGRGLAMAELKDFKQAIANFNKALTLDPSCEWIWYDRGKLLIQLARYEEAIESLKKAISYKSDYFEAWYWIGIAHTKQKNYGQSINSYKEALLLKENHASLWRDLGDAQRHNGQHKEALDSYDHAIKLNQSYAEAWYGHGLVLAELRRYDDAIKDYENALTLNPKLYWIWYDRGKALRLNKKYREAILSFDQSINEKQDYVDVHYEKIKCYVALNEIDAALRGFETITLLDKVYSERVFTDPDFITIWQDERFRSALNIEPNKASIKKNPSENLSSPLLILISYAHEDSDWLTELKKNLKPFIRVSSMKVWDDTAIPVGSDWKLKIMNTISSTKAAVLLVSHNYLDSDFIYEVELPAIFDAAKEGHLKILWFTLDSCAYDKISLLVKCQALAKPDQPLVNLNEADKQTRFVDICRKIEEALGLSDTLSDV